MTDLNDTIVPTTETTPKLEAVTPIAAEKATEATQQTTGNWNELKTRLKTKFTMLTEADLHYENGKKDEMFTRIQEKLGKSKEELSAIIAGL